ncbi:MAG: hypothetical protein EPO08_17700 [Rhodospirillaceae bacterium]|nr:MAG: hypothetical protein EPO08_17700 [Rhodospirillaceae bacterium]
MSAGGQDQSQNSYNSGNFSGTSTTTPNAPAGYADAWNSILGMNGATPGQAAATNYYMDQLNKNAPSGLLKDVNQTLWGTAQWHPGQITQQPAVSAPTISAPSAQTALASNYMGNYLSPYTQNVVNSTMANYDQNAANQLNALRASRDAGSAFGDRANISDGQFLNQSDLNRAQTVASLENQGFTTALGAGQSDAANATNTNVANAGFALNASQLNAQNALAAQEFNNTQNYQTQAQNVANILNSAENITMPSINQIGNNLVTGNSMNNNAANNLANLGSAGFQQRIAGLAAGNPLFGSTMNTSGQSQGYSSGSSSGSSKGFSL